ELAKDPKSILKVSGAEALRSRISASLDSNTTMLGRVAQRIKQAASDIKANLKPHHAALPARALSRDREASFSGTPKSVKASPLTPGLTSDDVTIIIVVAAIVVPPLQAALLAIAAGVLAAELTLGAVALIGRLVTNLGTEKGKDKVAACMD